MTKQTITTKVESFNWTRKRMNKGLYKGYRIEKEWYEHRGRIAKYTVCYYAYNENGDEVDCRDKLKWLKGYIDSMERSTDNKDMQSQNEN